MLITSKEVKVRQYRFIIFKDGCPWKGFFDEVAFINEYEKEYDALRQQYAKQGLYTPLAVHEVVIPEFFRRFQPVRYDGSLRRFVSLLREYIMGSNPEEASVVLGIDWEDLGMRERSLFEYIDKHFQRFLIRMTREEILRAPSFGVTRGSKNLSKI